MDLDKIYLGNILRKKRLERNLSLRALAREIGTCHTEIARLENGEKKTINYNLLLRLCDYFNLDALKLLKETNNLDENKLKTFNLRVKKVSKEEYEIDAKNDKEAINILMEYFKEIYEENDDDSLEFFFEIVEEKKKNKCRNHCRIIHNGIIN